MQNNKTSVIIALFVGLVLGFLISSFMPKSIKEVNQSGSLVSCVGKDSAGNIYYGHLSENGQDCIPNDLGAIIVNPTPTGDTTTNRIYDPGPTTPIKK